jgi:hypothetical protein
MTTRKADRRLLGVGGAVLVVVAAAGAARLLTAGPVGPPAPTPTPTYNVRDYGAVGDGKADDTAAIQAAIDAAPAGDVVAIPRGKYRITGTLVVPKTLALVGAMAYTQAVDRFGSQSYGTSWEWGSVIVHDAQAGAAIDHTPGIYTGLRVENLVLVGKGKADAPTTGIHVAFPAGAVTVSMRLVHFSNFAVGLDLDTVENSRFDDLRYNGCDVGIRCSGATSANTFTSVNMSGCGDGIVLGGGKNAFIGGAIQGCSRTGILIAAGEENSFRDLYFEDADAAYAIDAGPMSDATVIAACHFGARGDNVRIRSNWAQVYAAKYAAGLEVTGRGAYVVGNWTGPLAAGPGNFVLGADRIRTPQLTVDGAAQAGGLSLDGGLQWTGAAGGGLWGGGGGLFWTPAGGGGGGAARANLAAPPAPAAFDTLRVRELVLTGPLRWEGDASAAAVDFGDGRRWAADGLYPGNGVKFPGSGALQGTEDGSLRWVDWVNRKAAVVVKSLRGR